MLKLLLVPNRDMFKKHYVAISLFWFAIIMTIWQFYPNPMVERPAAVFASVPRLLKEGMVQLFFQSFSSLLLAMLLGTGVALLLAYISRVNLFAPLVDFFTFTRFLSLNLVIIFTGLYFIQDLYWLKVFVLAFTIGVGVLTSMRSVVKQVPESDLEVFRVLGMSEWEVLYRGVIRNTLPDALDSMRQASAFGWAILIAAETLSYAEGGLGTLIANELRFRHYDGMAFILLFTFGTGLLQDQMLLKLGQKIFPWYTTKR